MEVVIKNVRSLIDLERIENIAQDIWTEHYTPIIGTEQVRYMLDKFQSVQSMKNQLDHGYEYFQVLRDDQLVGYFSFLPKEAELFISKFYVVKDMRGKGVGRQCMEFLKDEVKNRLLSELSLTVNKYNQGTINMYKTMGFVVTDEVVVDIGNGFVMDDYVMKMEC